MTRQSRDAMKLTCGKSQLRVWRGCGVCMARDSTFPTWWAAKSKFGSTISHLFLRSMGQETSWEVGLACYLCPAPSAQERLEGVEGFKGFMNSLGRKGAGLGPAWEQKNIQDLGALVQIYLMTMEASNTHLNMTDILYFLAFIINVLKFFSFLNCIL